MTHTAFFDLARQTAHAALNGSQPPALSGKLLTHLKVIAKCFVGDVVVTVDTGTAEFLILAKTSASGEASLIDSTAVLNTSDPDEPQYEFEWNPADSVQLRTVLDAAADPTAPVELRYEFRFERSGNQGCIGGPIYFLNNFFRPETPAPEATLNTSWETLKSRIAAGNNVTRTVNDATKVITLSVPDFADGADGREIELQVTSTHIQWRYVGVSTWTNLIALSAITGANGSNGTNGTNGTNGSSVELQVTSTHIQWRLVGAATWTNLVALSTITGPAGSNGSNGSSVELQVSSTHIQWRLVGGGSWTDLVALSTITGPAGEDGASGGGGFVTGMEVDYAIDAAPSGWVRKNGGTIGSPGSSATERAHADAEALYTLLWQAYSDAQCSVSGGRGASAAEDFAADKPLTLPDARGNVTVPQKTGSFGTLGGLVGAETHTLDTSELPVVADHTHTQPTHSHDVPGLTFDSSTVSGSNAGAYTDGGITPFTTAPSGGDDTGAAGGFGGGGAHNNIQPSVVTGCRIIKL